MAKRGHGKMVFSRSLGEMLLIFLPFINITLCRHFGSVCSGESAGSFLMDWILFDGLLGILLKLAIKTEKKIGQRRRSSVPLK